MKILFALELGNGFGHIARLLPIAEGLQELGHTVSWVLSNPEFSDKIPKNCSYRVLKKLLPPEKYILKTISLTHVFYNLGYQNEENIKNRVSEWHEIFEEENPDLLVFDFCPSILIANLTTKIKMFHIGDGFTIPPQVKPYGVLLPSSIALNPESVKEIIEAEDRLLSVINSACPGQNITSLSQLYGSCNQAALLSYPELDHYGHRDNAGYYGVMTKNGTDVLKKYRGGYTHALVYLKDFDNIGKFVDVLLSMENLGLTFYIGEPAIPEKIIKKIKKRKNTVVLQGPINFESAGKNCDFIISHGNHTTTAQALSVGLPLLVIPIDSEKVMVADRIGLLGAGLICSKDDPRVFSVKLSYFMNPDKLKKLKEGALRFQEKYRHFDYEASMKSLIERINSLL